MADAELLKAVARQRDAHNQQIKRFAAPAVGADFTIAVPGNEVWRVLSFRASLTTSAAVPARNPTLAVDDQTDIAAQVSGALAIAASLTTAVNFVADLGMGPIATTSLVACSGMPQMILPGGYRLRTITGGLDAADQWSGAAVWVEMMNEPPYLTALVGTELEEMIHDAYTAQQEGLS
jgi:hypothetical protein